MDRKYPIEKETYNLMKVLYVASRYHTNQVPIIKGWIEQGHQVMFLSQFQAGSEDYTVLTPSVMGYSSLFEFILKIYRLLFKKHLQKAAIPSYFQAQFGFPSISAIKKKLKEFKPDVVILRDRCIYNAVIYHYCRKNDIPGILYNQTPFWETINEKNDIFRKLLRRACPQIRMTPVWGREDSNCIHKENTFFVPFVIEPHFSILEKEHFTDGKINILCIGKFENRKHHKELVKAISQLPHQGNYHVTLIGECSRESHKEYLQQLNNTINECQMVNQVVIKCSLSYSEVYDEYKKADLFILPSTGEFASISQLEAMSCSLPVICSDTNGVANCVKEGENGFLFQDKDFEDLKNKIQLAAADRNKLMQMGKNSYEIIKDDYSFEKYETLILEMMKLGKK